MPVSLQDIANRSGYSVKSVSGALHGGSARMSEATREKILGVAKEMGYVINLAARATRQGWIPLIGIIADELITTPFATDILRGLDNAVRARDMAVFATNFGPGRSVNSVYAELQRFRPKAIGYAAMYHKVIQLPDDVSSGLSVLINCRDAAGRVPSIVPDDEQAARDITRHLIERGRRRIAFINLPGLLAGSLREKGFIAALAEAGLDSTQAPVLPAVSAHVYTDRSRRLVQQHVEALTSGPNAVDAILAGNDRVAMEVYAALRRRNLSIPGDVAVAGFDNQVEIVTRLDPPLTTMALPHRRMGQLAAAALLGEADLSAPVQELRFRLVQRKST
ncbi:MAG TPA: LacI family DNA-binding transcriptional regulator [Devosiaceae bacterium]|jgi:DNA-binding LacI/PurR family transcriptional regulator|nr:LacI family DNA-binding transcriptional regulator [Devosiaceae bacterium]